MPSTRGGIHGFDDPKFWIAAVLHIASWTLFFEGPVSWDEFQVVMPFLVSFVVLSTVAWDYRELGDPNRLHNLLLHLLFLVSLIFLLNRLMAAGTLRPVDGQTGLLGMILREAVDRIPGLATLYSVFRYVLRWLGFAVLFFFLAGAIIFPRRIAMALLFLCGLTTVAVSVGRDLDVSLWSLFAGLALLAGTVYLQRADDQAGRFWSRVAEAFSASVPGPRMDTEIKLALLAVMRRDGAVTENQVRTVVAAKLGRPAGDPGILPICGRIVGQMAHADGLAEGRDSGGEWRFVLNLPPEAPDFFTVCARTVRILVITGFCLIYILSPIDLIPDATPVFGVVDDMLLGGAGLLSVVKTIHDTVRPRHGHRNAEPFSRRMGG